MKFKAILYTSLIAGLLAFIIYLSAWVRISTINSKTVLDYDPHWYYRHALEIMSNNYIPPKWDILSYYPPGRPFDNTPGWPYLMILFHKIAQIFQNSIEFLTVAKWSPIIMVALGVIPAFFIGKIISNEWGGLVTAILAVLSPTFIGVSMAAYTDNDPVVVFYTFLSTLTIILALKKVLDSYKNKKKILSATLSSFHYILLAYVANVLFAFTWTGGWLPIILFIFFIPALIVFRLIEQFIHTFSLKLNFSEIILEAKPIITTLSIITLLANLISYLFNFPTLIDSFKAMLGFIGGVGGLIVNISVEELQPINVFSLQGFLTIVGRTGLLPTLFTFIGLPIFVIFKLYKKEKTNFVEIFLFLWAIASFYSIVRGTRFSLEFSLAAATTTGYIIGNVIKYFKFSSNNDEKLMIFASAFLGIVFVMLIMFLSDAIRIGIAATGMEISNNWYDALDWLKANGNSSTLVVTWWDPGHIIANVAGLKVMADGAHCGPEQCIPYNHNMRIQDMGAAFSTSDENVSIAILRRYLALTPEQCNEARKVFGSIMPENACEPITKMYLLATSDLIGKYYWLSYFGSCIVKNGVKNIDICHNLNLEQLKKIAEGRNYIHCIYSSELSQQLGAASFACQVNIPMAISIVQQNDNFISVLNSPQQGIRNAIVTNTLIYQNGIHFVYNYKNASNTVDGLVFVEANSPVLLFMDSKIRDSVFTNMFFFNGQGNQQLGIPKLNHFKLVYQNPEVKIFEVIF
jgi:asparagine N-glycosylation enzyme membrane subunit Stt3